MRHAPARCWHCAALESREECCNSPDCACRSVRIEEVRSTRAAQMIRDYSRLRRLRLAPMNEIDQQQSLNRIERMVSRDMEAQRETEDRLYPKG